MLPLNKSYKNRKASLTLHCKYKYFDSTVQRAEDRRQKFYFCRLPFAVNVKLNLSTDTIFSRALCWLQASCSSFDRCSRFAVFLRLARLWFLWFRFLDIQLKTLHLLSDGIMLILVYGMQLEKTTVFIEGTLLWC